MPEGIKKADRHPGQDEVIIPVRRRKQYDPVIVEKLRQQQAKAVVEGSSGYGISVR